MLDNAPHLSLPPAPARAVLRMVEGDRTAGSIPVWERRRDGVETPGDSLSSALSYAAQPGASDKGSQEFGFGDLLDMINPLQHIPLVSHLYRSLTGDNIRPAAQIVGGTIYGGPVGAAAGLVNVIAQEETGRDITGNVLALARGEKIDIRSTTPDNPEERLNQVAARTEATMPPTALSFAAARIPDIAPAAGTEEIVWNTPRLEVSIPSPKPRVAQVWKLNN